MKKSGNLQWKMIINGIMVCLPLIQIGRQAKTQHLVCPFLNRTVLPKNNLGTDINWVQKLDLVLGMFWEGRSTNFVDDTVPP